MLSAAPLRRLPRPTSAGVVVAAPRMPLPRLLLLRPAAAAFSSSAAAAAVAEVGSAIPPPPVRLRKAATKPPTKKSYKRQKLFVPVKKPPVGERKAFRQRVQTSNVNALQVRGAGELGARTLASPDSGGKVLAIPRDVVEQLRALQALKPTQSWSLFHRPHVLVREQTLDLVARMEAAAETKQAVRCVLTGARLAGKSLLQAQAMCHALLNGWVVIHIHEGMDLVNGNTEYGPIKGVEPRQFAQPIYTLKLLRKIHEANRAVLESLPLQMDYPRTASLGRGATVADLVLGARESERAWQTFTALWQELTQPGRPPVLLCLDGLAHINRKSRYRDADFEPIHSHELALVRHFLDALSGAAKLPNGGAVVAATSESNTYRVPSQDLVLGQIEAVQAGRAPSMPDPYERDYDSGVYDALKDCAVLRLPGLSRQDTRALMEYWAKSGIFKGLVDHQAVCKHWALAGNGVIGELERVALTTSRI